jgi:sugar phosphate isomerase/epimerase
VRALGPAVKHVHLKDTEVVEDEVALAGVLDARPFTDPNRRAWNFRAAGAVHDRAWWTGFVAALRAAGYDDALSIENEDAGLPPETSVEEAAAMMRSILGA